MLHESAIFHPVKKENCPFACTLLHLYFLSHCLQNREKQREEEIWALQALWRMLTGVNQTSKKRFSDTNPPEFSNSHHGDRVRNAIYESDEFRMYTFKIRRCSKTRAHDWTECPYAHRGEKARRRDPRKFKYCPVACPDFRRGGCRRGDSCELAHGVFEFWLHPARYRTHVCMAGKDCRRKVCFFAHTPEQLRTGKGNLCDCVYRICVEGSASPPENESGSVVDWSLVEVMRELNIGGDEKQDREEERSCLGAEMSDCPDIDWISELVSSWASQ